ncbi:MAG TPA: alpha/beta hydrolase-fold protein [Vicinamibacteria bacterium]|nr:alpha/beta hydrolase-fold protein [Vicinamibacteria bacterium]
MILALGVLAAPASAQTDYPLGPDSERHAGVPSGTVTKHSWTSRIFPGTQRDYWVYVPAQYRAETPAALMVFQDGKGYVAEEGRWRVPVVFDNLIAKGEMPVTIGLFVDPGVLPARSAEEQARYDRSFEYDGLGDRYARFLIEELLPEVAKTAAISPDPNLRAIGGSSSGGVCAFTAAWNRPDAFRRVLSFIGSYTGLRGGDGYATLVRKSEPKPIRVFLQDGSRDLNIYSGNWWIGNQGLASALDYAGYDVRFVEGDRGHDGIHGSAVLPDALRWLWRDWTQPIAASRGKAGAERHYATEILDPAAPGWQLVVQASGPIRGLAASREGDVYFSDAQTIRKVSHATAGDSAFSAATDVRSLAFGPDGRLFAALDGPSGIAVFDAAGHRSFLDARGPAADLAIDARGTVWMTDRQRRRVVIVDAHPRPWAALENAEAAGTLVLSPDQALLAIADPDGRAVWSYQVAPDGTLRHGQAFYRLEAPEGSSAGAGGMTVDSEGFLYVASALGIQVFDQPGRLTAILSGPPGAPPSRIVFGGPQLDTLYAAAGDKLFRRTLRRKGVWPGQPVKPPMPRL